MAALHFSRKGVRTRNSGRTARGTDGSGDDRSLPDAVYTYLPADARLARRLLRVIDRRDGSVVSSRRARRRNRRGS